MPVYRLAKTQATDLKRVHKEEDCTKTKSVSVAYYGGNCSSKAKNYVSGKDNTVSGSKTVERGPSKSLNSNNASTVPQRTEETSKGSLDKSSHRSPSKLKKQLMSPSLVYAEQKEQAQNVLKRKYRGEAPPWTGNDSNTIKTREPSKTSSVSRDSLRQKRTDLVKELCRKHQEHKLEAKRSLCTEAKTPSASTTKQTSTSAKHTTSVSSSNVVKNVSSTSVPHKTAKSSSAQQQTCSLSSPLPPDFKIPKKDQARPVNSTGENNDATSTNRSLKHRTELSDSRPSVSNSKQETVRQAHSCLDVSPSFPSQGQDKRSYLSGQHPATFDTVTEPWYDQVIKETFI